MLEALVGQQGFWLLSLLKDLDWLSRCVSKLAGFSSSRKSEFWIVSYPPLNALAQKWDILLFLVTTNLSELVTQQHLQEEKEVQLCPMPLEKNDEKYLLGRTDGNYVSLSWESCAVQQKAPLV